MSNWQWWFQWYIHIKLSRWLNLSGGLNWRHVHTGLVGGFVMLEMKTTTLEMKYIHPEIYIAIPASCFILWVAQSYHHNMLPTAVHWWWWFMIFMHLSLFGDHGIRTRTLVMMIHMLPQLVRAQLLLQWNESRLIAATILCLLSLSPLGNASTWSSMCCDLVFSLFDFLPLFLFWFMERGPGGIFWTR